MLIRGYGGVVFASGSTTFLSTTSGSQLQVNVSRGDVIEVPRGEHLKHLDDDQDEDEETLQSIIIGKGMDLLQ